MTNGLQAVEHAAKAIFELMPHNGTLGSLRPAWEQAEAATQRDEALRYAHAAAPFFSPTPSPQAEMVCIPAGCVEEFYEGDEVAYLRDTLKEVTKERDHFHNQWRACWAPLTPRSENEKKGVDRVLAILKSKLSDGGGIVGPSEVQRAHNDFYRGRRVAFEECATMLRAALTTEGSAQ